MFAQVVPWQIRLQVQGGHLTRIERDVVKLDDKEGLTHLDLSKIMRSKEQTKEHDRDFDHCRVHVENFIQAEDKAALDSEEAVFDQHVNPASDVIERQEQLEDAEFVMPHASDKGVGWPEVRSIAEAEHISQGASKVHDFLMKAKRVLEEKEMDMVC